MKTIISDSKKEIHYKDIGTEKGIVVQVYQKTVSILSSDIYNGSEKTYAFIDIKGTRNANISCSSFTIEEAMKKVLESKAELYLFDSLQELAVAIIKNQWE